MKTVTITLREYCSLAGYSYESNWVQKNLAQGIMMVGMVNFRKVGTNYLIDVLKSWHDGKVN